MFYFLEDFDIANYADDSTPYYANKSAEHFFSNLKQSSTIISKLLNNNMKVNTSRNHLLIWGNARAKATISNSNIESEDEQILLDKTIDSNFTFQNHINSVCKKVS